MILTNLRSSSINTFLSCQMAWFMEYNLGWDSGISKAAIKGTVVHHVLELLALLKKAEQDGKKSISTELGSRLTTDKFLGRDDLIDKLTVKVYNTYIDKYDSLAWKDYDKKDCIKWTKKTLNDWDGQFDPRNRNIIQAEEFFDIEIVEPWAAYKYTLPDGSELKGFLSLKGTIDLVTELDDCIEIVDYKTGQRKAWYKNTDEKMTIKDIKDGIQPRMYHWVMSQKYPDKQIIVTMLYIKDGGPFTVYFSPDDLTKTKKLIKYHFSTIQKAAPECRKSWKCGKWCEYGKTTFEDTSVIPLNHGRTLTKCEQTEYVLQHKSMNEVLNHMSCGKLRENLDAYQQG